MVADRRLTAFTIGLPWGFYNHIITLGGGGDGMFGLLETRPALVYLVGTQVRAPILCGNYADAFLRLPAP